MKANRIGLYQTGILTFFFTRCFFITGLIPFLFETSGIDSLISILLGTILGFLLVWLYLTIMKKEKKQTILETIDLRFPKTFSFFLKGILLLTLLLLGSFLLSKVTLYIHHNFLEEVSFFVITLTFFLLCHFVSKDGLETIARSAEILFFLFAIFFLLSLIGILPFMEPSRLKPFFSKEWLKISQSSFIYGFFNSIPLFLLTMIPLDKIQNKKKGHKAILLGYLVASFTIFVTFMIMIGTLGIDLASYYPHPETAILKKVTYFHFIERIEGLFAIEWLLDSVVVIAFLLFSVQSLLKTFPILKTKKVWYFLFCILFVLLGSKWQLSLEQLFLPFFLSFFLLPLFVLFQICWTKKKT